MRAVSSRPPPSWRAAVPSRRARSLPARRPERIRQPRCQQGCSRYGGPVRHTVSCPAGSPSGAASRARPAPATSASGTAAQPPQPVPRPAFSASRAASPASTTAPSRRTLVNRFARRWPTAESSAYFSAWGIDRTFRLCRPAPRRSRSGAGALHGLHAVDRSYQQDAHLRPRGAPRAGSAIRC